jgi:N6-adenosine-specific RNA methylase IME4
MREMNSLIVMSHAEKLLAEATTVQKAKELKDLSLTAADWAKRKDLGEEAIRHARMYAFLAERRMGELLIQTERHPAGRPSRIGRGSRPIPPKLKDLGISKDESSQAQFVASLSEKDFEGLRGGDITLTEAKRRAKRQMAHEKIGSPNEVSGKFLVIYADPPWQYGNKGLTEYGHAESHYPTLSIAELCALDVKSLAEDDAVLFLWVTAPMLREAFEVLKAWGFEYKTNMVWDKVKHNFGHYTSVRHEHLLICIRGSCTPDNAKLFDSVQSVERTEKHSEKPEQFRKIIETLYTRGKKLELFARSEHEGWTSFGNEVLQ